MENKGKVLENDKTLFDNENLNRNLLKDLIYYVEEFLSKKDEITKHLADIIKRIFYSNLKVLDKNVSNNVFALHQTTSSELILYAHFLLFVIVKHVCNVNNRHNRIPSLSLFTTDSIMREIAYF